VMWPGSVFDTGYVYCNVKRGDVSYCITVYSDCDTGDQQY